MKIKSLYSNVFHNKNIKNGILYTLFSFINNGIGFILLFVLAKYLAPSEYGKLNLFTTFVTLLNIIISLSTVSYITNSYFRKSLDDMKRIIMISFMTSTVMLLVISLWIILFSSSLEDIVGISTKFLWLGVLISYMTVFNNVNLDIWRLEEKPVSYGIYGITFAVTNFILSFALIVWMKEGWEGRVYAWIYLSIIYFIISVLFLIKRKYLVFKLPSSALIRETLVYALPLVPHSLSYWLKQGSDRFIINYYWDSAAVGFFSFAMNFASIINVIGTAFNSSNSVYIYKSLSLGYIGCKDVLDSQFRKMTIVFILITLCVIVISMCFIMTIMPNYVQSINFIIPLCMGGFFQCIYLLSVNYLFYYKKTKKLMYITFSMCSLQIIFSLYFTKFGIVYTAYISMLFSLFTMMSVYFSSKAILNNELKNK